MKKFRISRSDWEMDGDAEVHKTDTYDLKADAFTVCSNGLRFMIDTRNAHYVPFANLVKVEQIETEAKTEIPNDKKKESHGQWA